MGRLAGFKQFMYNSEEGTVMGRGGKSWAKVLLFYLVYYMFLAGFFIMCFSVFTSTLPPTKDGPRHKFIIQPSFQWTPKTRSGLSPNHDEHNAVVKKTTTEDWYDYYNNSLIYPRLESVLQYNKDAGIPNNFLPVEICTPTLNEQCVYFSLNNIIDFNVNGTPNISLMCKVRKDGRKDLVKFQVLTSPDQIIKENDFYKVKPNVTYTVPPLEEFFKVAELPTGSTQTCPADDRNCFQMDGLPFKPHENRPESFYKANYAAFRIQVEGPAAKTTHENYDLASFDCRLLYEANDKGEVESGLEQKFRVLSCSKKTLKECYEYYDVNEDLAL